jgi:hypothetical protein
MRICVRCTKDTCANHLCDRCGACSDCCDCEIHLNQDSPVRTYYAGTHDHDEPKPHPMPDPDPAPDPDPIPQWPIGK